MSDEIVDIQVDDNSSLSELLSNWSSINKVKKDLLEKEELIRTKIKIFLKEHRWKSHHDEGTDITVEIVEGKMESFDKNKLKFMLSSVQYQEALKITVYEKLMINTPETRKRQQKFMNPKKK